MKNLQFIFAMLLVSVTGYGQGSDRLADTIYYSGTRLTHPLVEGWAKEFKKNHPGTEVKLLPSNEKPEKAAIRFLAYDLEHETFKPSETYVVVANYAQLPISNIHNPLLKEWNKKGLTNEAFKELYFKSKDTLSAQPTYHTVTIYKRDRPVCATKTFASNYGLDANKGRGIGVKGDDKSLLEAVLKDTNGISYNNLGFIYDLKTRKLVNGIAVIPNDFNGNGKIDADENIYGNLDVLITGLESGNISGITVGKVNIVHQSIGERPVVSEFIQYVLGDGQKINHQYGFLYLNTDQKILARKK